MLTKVAIKAAKPADKPYERSDETDLYLLTRPSGSRLWRFKYRVHGKEKLLALGSYPDTSLKSARDKRDDIRKLLDAGIENEDWVSSTWSRCPYNLPLGMWNGSRYAPPPCAAFH